MSGTMNDLYKQAKSIYDNPGEVKASHVLSGFGGLLAFVGLITFMILLNKNKKFSGNKKMASMFFMFVILSGLILQIFNDENEKDALMSGLAFLVLICVAGLTITLLM